VRRSIGCVAPLVALAAATLGAVSVPARASVPRVQVRAVLTMLPPASATSSTLAPAERVDAAVKVADCDLAAVQALAVVPTTLRTAKPAECAVYAEQQGGATTPRFFLGPGKVTNADVRKARAGFVNGQGWTVRLDLTTSGSRAWDDLTREQFHGQVAFVVDEKVVAAPTIQPSSATFESFHGVAVVSGVFGEKGAATIARLANSR